MARDGVDRHDASFLRMKLRKAGCGRMRGAPALRNNGLHVKYNGFRVKPFFARRHAGIPPQNRHRRKNLSADTPQAIEAMAAAETYMLRSIP